MPQMIPTTVRHSRPSKRPPICSWSASTSWARGAAAAAASQQFHAAVGKEARAKRAAYLFHRGLRAVLRPAEGAGACYARVGNTHAPVKFKSMRHAQAIVASVLRVRLIRLAARLSCSIAALQKNHPSAKNCANRYERAIASSHSN